MQKHRCSLGTSWRGRDCDDDDPDVHPGRTAKDGDAQRDSNCNGIYGKPTSGEETYEEKFCGGRKHYGVVMIGDSAGAHFHMPEAWYEEIVPLRRISRNLLISTDFECHSLFPGLTLLN